MPYLCPEEKFRGKIFSFCDRNMFFNYSSGDNSLAVLSELQSDCPEERLDGELL